VSSTIQAAPDLPTATQVRSLLTQTPGRPRWFIEIDPTGNIVSISSVDIASPAGQNAVSNNLVAGTPVEVFGVPQANGSIKAYVLFCYTGTKPTMQAPPSLLCS